MDIAKEAGAELVCGTSLKATLDRDWDQPLEKEEALTLVLQNVETWVQSVPQDETQVAHPDLKIAQQVEAQNVEVEEEGKASLLEG